MGVNKALLLVSIVSTAAFCQSALADQAPVRIGVFGNAGLTVESPVSDLAGSLGVSVKRGTDTARVAVSSASGQYEISADSRTRRTLAMVGMVSTGLEARGLYANGTGGGKFTDTALYLDGKGALGNIQVAGRLFSVKGYSVDNYVLGGMTSLSGIGVTAPGYITTRSGLTGAGLGLRYRASDILTLSGDVDWGWSNPSGSVLLTDAGIDLTELIPGTVSFGVKSQFIGRKTNTVTAAYSVGLGESALLKASVKKGLDESGAVYGVSGRYGFTKAAIEGRINGSADGLTVGGTAYLGAASNFNVSADYGFGTDKAKVGFGFKF